MTLVAINGLCSAVIFLLFTFLMNCLVSLLTGTAFGTAATMGVISMSLASALGLSPMWVGGAILAGVFFGDRCSPVSTSALLVATLTETNLYSNIRAMIKSANLPFIVSCLLYFVIGFVLNPAGQVQDAGSVLRRAFILSPFACFRRWQFWYWRFSKYRLKRLFFIFSPYRWLFAQNMPMESILNTMIFGYKAQMNRPQF